MKKIIIWIVIVVSGLLVASAIASNATEKVVPTPSPTESATTARTVEPSPPSPTPVSSPTPTPTKLIDVQSTDSDEASPSPKTEEKTDISEQQVPKVPATQATTGTEVVKKSKNNICHAPNTQYYDQTKHYTPYNTIEECLASGARLPKN